MTLSKLATTGLALAALALPVSGFAQDAKPGEFKIPGTDTTLKLNGFVEVDVTYDFDGADDDISGTDWASFVEFQPLDENVDQQDQPNRLYFTARTSRVGLTTNTPTSAGPLTVRVEGDFNSPSPNNFSTEVTTNGTDFRLRHAYGEFAGFLVGQTWSTFTDLLSLPDTVDFNPHGAFALTRQPMLRYSAKMGAGGSLAVSAENPQSRVIGADNGSSIGRLYDRFPDFIASLTLPFSMGHLNVRGVATEYGAEDFDTGVDDRKWGWGAGVSGSLKGGPLALVWSVQAGDGIGRYMFQSVFQGAGFVNGNIETWRTLAYHAGLTFALSPKARVNAIWTQTFFEEDDALATAVGDPFANERVDVAFLNLFVSPLKNTELGFEYVYGRRTIFDAVVTTPGNDTGTQHRVNALARYTFF
jgi:hypothetical protein